MKKMLIILLTFSIILGGCGKKDITDAASLEVTDDSIAVKTENIQTSVFIDSINLPGSVEAYEKNIVTSAIGGEVKVVNYKTGDFVQKNQIILQINDESYKLQLETAEIAVKNAELSFFKDEKDYLKFKELYDNNSISKNEFDNIDFKYNMSKLALQNANSMYTSAKLNNNYTKIAAPISGVISSMTLSKGERLNPGTPICQIVNNDKVYINTGVTEKNLAKISKNQEVSILGVFSDNKLNGSVTSISPTKNPVTNNYDIKVLAENNDNILKDGMSVNVEIILDKIESVPALNKNAVFIKNDSNYVYINESNTAKEVKVELGLSNDNYFQITSGLAVGDEVIIEGTGLLENGDKIRINN